MRSSQIQTKITSAALRKAEEAANRQIALRLKAGLKNAERAAQNFVEQRIKAHPVYKGLDGRFSGDTDGNDLQAEFGLDSGIKNGALRALLSIVKKTVKAEYFIRSGRSRPIHIVVEGANRSQYKPIIETDPRFRYISSKKQVFGGDVVSIDTEEIKWGYFLMNPRNSLESSFGSPRGKKYGISYNAGITNLSRSGRAVMLRKPSKGKKLVTFNKIITRYPYTTPKIARPVGSPDFIQDALKKPINGKSFKVAISEYIRNQLRRKQPGTFR